MCLSISGNGYATLEPPTTATFNHVVVYPPEFGVYDDPTTGSH